MKKKSILLSLIAIPFIIGCDGGSTTTTNQKHTKNTVKITGSVPGTLIEAFCQDGTYVKVSSTKNGTSKHPFEIDIPQDTACKLMMTTNEESDENRVITEIGFTNGGDKGTTLSTNGDLDLDYIPLAMEYASIVDSDGNHVADEPMHVTVSTKAQMKITNTPVFDRDNNNLLDAYEDDDNNGVVNAYEDDDNDNIPNIKDDDNHNNYPDYIEDDDNDGMLNMKDDDDKNSNPDYTEDDDNDGIKNHLDDDNKDCYPDYVEQKLVKLYKKDKGSKGSKEKSEKGSKDDECTYSPMPTPPTTPTPTPDPMPVPTPSPQPTPTPSPAPTTLFATDVMPVFNANCKNCHGNSGKFTVTTASGTYSNLMSNSFINTANPSNSVILLRASGTGHGGGTILPTGSTGYNTIKAWISEGALNN